MERGLARGDARPATAGSQGARSTALAEVALLRDADLPRGAGARRAGARAARGRRPGGPLRGAARCAPASAGGSATSRTTSADRARRSRSRSEIGRKDLEASAADELASAAIARLDLDRGRAARRARRSSSPRRAAASSRAARALVSQARIDCAARAASTRPRPGSSGADELFSEAGAAWALARTLNHSAGSSAARGDLAAAERRFREAIRILKPLEDRGTLCESQRGLAQLLLAARQVDEAERFALEARETVGPHDNVSRATTRMALGLVRAAQGRDEEAEAAAPRGGRRCSTARTSLPDPAASCSRALRRASSATAGRDDEARGDRRRARRLRRARRRLARRRLERGAGSPESTPRPATR